MKVLAILFFILLSPFSICIAIIISISTQSHFIFKQKRIGKDKNTFTIYKFKSMHNNKIFMFGKVIRKLGLDEIPQLVNIIKNEMSFVGPRPLTEFDIDRLGWNKKSHSKRWSVKPGITGFAQLLKTCNADLSLQNDFNYIDNKSTKLDLTIFFKSILVPFVGKLTK